MVLRIRMRDPVLFWPLDPGWEKNLEPWSGINIVDLSFGNFYLMRIQDLVNPRSATLIYRIYKGGRKDRMVPGSFRMMSDGISVLNCNTPDITHVRCGNQRCHFHTSTCQHEMVEYFKVPSLDANKTYFFSPHWQKFQIWSREMQAKAFPANQHK